MDRIDKTYREVRADLARMESFFAGRGMDPTEVRSEAGYQFARFARRGYDPERVRRRVYSALRDLERNRRGRKREVRPGPLTPDVASPAFEVRRLLADLGDDARLLVRVALEEADKVRVLARAEGMGWTLRKVVRAWREIREALS